MIINPITIKGDSYSRLSKLDESKHSYDEAWLQNVIHQNPGLYPLENPLDNEIQIISLGREISCNVGFIDIMLLSSDAEIIIVETKLWRNPEKTRSVLAQVIDYAKELSNWDYDDLNNAFIGAQRNNKVPEVLTLKDLITKEFPNIDFIDYVERLIHNLNQGNLILSIIGDRISPNLLLLSESVQSSPGLNFHITLVEMKLFSSNDEIIVIPDIVGKTKEVTRGVVKIQFEQEKPKVEIKYLEDEKARKSKSKTDKNTFISQFPDDISQLMEKWLNEWLNNPRLLVYWGIRGISVRRQLNDKWVTILDIFPDCISLVTQTLADQSEIPDNLHQDYLTAIFEIDGIQSFYSSKKRYVNYKNLSTEDCEIMLNETGRLIDRLLS